VTPRSALNDDNDDRCCSKSKIIKAKKYCSEFEGFRCVVSEVSKTRVNYTNIAFADFFIQSVLNSFLCDRNLHFGVVRYMAVVFHHEYMQRGRELKHPVISSLCTLE